MKKLFNFYLEDSVKLAAIKKLEDKMGKTEKGALAALIRVLLNDFVFNNKDCTDLVRLVEEEYTYCKLKNKRSTL